MNMEVYTKPVLERLMTLVLTYAGDSPRVLQLLTVSPDFVHPHYGP